MTIKNTKRIGLVDDEELVRFATKALLTMHQYEVEAFESAESFLAAGSLENFDCLIIDFRMSGLSGLGLLKELQKRSSKIPSVVVSGYTSASEMDELNAAGATAIMDKPVNTKELVANLERIINAPLDE